MSFCSGLVSHSFTLSRGAGLKASLFAFDGRRTTCWLEWRAVGHLDGVGSWVVDWRRVRGRGEEIGGGQDLV